MFNFINIKDAKGLIPLALVALVGFGIYYVWNKTQTSKAQAAAATQSLQSLGGSAYSGAQSASGLESLALLSSLLGGSTTSQGLDGGTSGTPTITAGSSTYNSGSATNTGSIVGGNNNVSSGVNVQTTAQTAPATSGSVVSTPVTQGV